MSSMEKGDVEAVSVLEPPVDWANVGWKKNPLKSLFFAQVTPLISEGTVRRLEATDLCHLDALDSQVVRLASERAIPRVDVNHETF